MSPHLLVLDHQCRAAASGTDLLGGAGVEVRVAGVDRVAAGRQDGGRVDGQLSETAQVMHSYPCFTINQNGLKPDFVKPHESPGS